MEVIVMTTNLDVKFPDVVYDRSFRDKIGDLINEDWSPFKGRTIADVYIYSMAYAFSHNMKPKALDPKPMKLPPYAFDIEKRTLMRSLAIHVKNDIRVIKNNNEVVTICSEYANAGLGPIYNALNNKDLMVTSENVLEKFLEELQEGHG